jgi:hypothetical protein
MPSTTGFRSDHESRTLPVRCRQWPAVLAVALLFGLPNMCAGSSESSIELKLPKLEAADPMDGHVRVGLLPVIGAAPDPKVYDVVIMVGLSFPSEASGFYGSAPAYQAGMGVSTDIHVYTLALAKAFSRRLNEVVHQLFPRTTDVPAGTVPRGEDLQFKTEMAAKLIEDPQSHKVGGVVVVARLTVVDAGGKRLDVLVGLGRGLSTTRKFIRTASIWRDLATQPLLQAIDQLVNGLRASLPLKLYLADLAEHRALPASLVTTAHFDDTGGVLPNGRLDAGEEGRLLIQVANGGPGTAYGVALQVTSDLPQIAVSGDGALGDLAPGGKKEIALRVAGRLDLASAIAQLRIEAAEKRGYGARPVLFKLPTARLAPSRLEIVDVTLNDRSGRASGDGDGQPANGETIEAVVRVRNAGPGEAGGVAVSMASRETSAQILEPKVVLPHIAADQVGEARLLFRLPLTLAASKLSLVFQAVEARGEAVGSAAKEQSWPIRLRRPGVELAYRLFDGGSPGSLGNRDGQINNGERIEVVVTPANRGDLPARGVRIAVGSDDAGLVPLPASLDVGDLPAGTEGPAQRFSLAVPRSFGLDRPAGDLHLVLTVSQQDFPPRREPIALAFRALRPELSLEAMMPPALARGAAGELVLRLRNTGTLRAEEVVLELTAETSGVDLLDERGVPVRSRRIALGALDIGATSAEPRLGIEVRRSAAVGRASFRIALAQKDLPSTVASTGLAVVEEPAAVIEAARTEERVAKTAPRTGAAPATISFLRNTPGEHLMSESAVLRFEIQSPADLAEVRLTQNERRLPLESARRSASAAGGLEILQYELPVLLEDGGNRFEVVAVTRQGLRTARALTLIRDHDRGRVWVVAVGISKYQDSAIRGLGYADADARAVHDYFRDALGLPESQLFLRTNEQATLREIKSTLGTQLVAKANDPRDTVILYFAGHGMRDRVTGSLDPDGLSKYFLPYDASLADPYSTALEMDEVTNILRRLVPERVVVLLDSCFSGAAGGRSPFDPKSGGERAPISGEFLDRMAHVGKGRVVLTASGPDEAPQESADLGHGLFTYYLLEALRGAADANGDGDIDVHEAYAYVSEKVSRATRGRQNPKLKEPDLVGQILIGRGAVRRLR